jgi:hypothetical protein
MKRISFPLSIAIILSILATGCKSTQTAATITKQIESQKFLESPFGHNESIAAFNKTLPDGTRIRKLARKNVHYPSKTDTIYQFKYKGSEIFVYKSNFNKEILMAGSILDPQIKLINGISTGITKDQLYNAINDIKRTEADTIKISTSSKDRNFSFIFKKGKLKKIKFDSYYD